MEKKDQFIEKVQNIFGPKHAMIMRYLYSRPPLTFRVNTNRINSNEAILELKSRGFKIKTGPLKNSYVLEDSPANLKLSQTKLFNEGKIYIQKLSSMVPVILLEPQEGEKILDMCAAPGSKTSQIALITKGKSQIVAVDNNKNRIYKMEANLATQGFSNVEIINANAVGLERKFKLFNNYFDRILLDAPCSNEGLICLSDPTSFEYWNPKLPKKLSKLQKKLAASAIEMLRPGGTLVYSTCTFSKEENEDVVAWIVKKFKKISLVEVKKILPDGLFTGFFAAKLVKLE
jgi:16S rRNA (cytosine1407-C5)-methyltransferase